MTDIGTFYSQIYNYGDDEILKFGKYSTINLKHKGEKCSF